MIAVRFYELSHGKENIVAINRRFKGISFTKEQLHKLCYSRKDR